MPRKRFSPEQMVTILRQIENRCFPGQGHAGGLSGTWDWSKSCIAGGVSMAVCSWTKPGVRRNGAEEHPAPTFGCGSIA